MATAEPAWRLSHPDEPEPDELVNVVRLVTFLGPVSPELVLVDPDLAERARALLPEAPSVRRTRSRLPAGRAPLPAPSSSSRDWLHRRPLVVALVAGAAAAASVVTWWVAPALRDGEVVPGTRLPTGATRATVEPPRSSAPSVTPPAHSKAQAARKASSAPSSEAAGLAPPRFVWPAQPDADGYRVALFRAGQRIFERDVVRPALALPLLWTYDGRSYGLTRGAYRWVVWPLVGREKQIGAAIVSAQYVA